MNKYLKAVSYNLAYFVISTLCFLILTPLAIHIMGGEFFGLWSILFAVNQFANVGTLGIGTIVNKLSSEKNCTETEISSILSSAMLIVLPMAFVTSLILFLLINPLVNSIKPSEDYIYQFRYALIICSFGIIPQFMGKVFQGFFLSQLMNRIVRTLEFVSSIFPWVGGVVISLYEKNLIWLSTWNLIIQIAILLFFIWSIRKYIHWNWSPNRAMFQKILNYSKFMFLEWSAGAVFQLIDRIVVGITLGSVAAGVYTVATSIGLRLPMVCGYATEIMVPYASLKNSMGENDILYKSFRRLSGYISLIIAGLSSFCILWMYEILALWISPEYASTYYVFFSIVILAYGFVSLSRPAHQTLTGLGHIKFTSFNYLLASGLMITSLFVFSRNFGLFGAGFANMVMIILLAMNIGTYNILNNKVALNDVFSDLRWGILLPAIAYFIVHVNALWYFRAGFSIFVGMVIFSSIHSDPFVADQFRQIKNKFLPGLGD